jgi:hypothetical protein
VALTASGIDGALLKGSGGEQRTRWGMTWGIHLAEWMWGGGADAVPGDDSRPAWPEAGRCGRAVAPAHHSGACPLG